MTRVTLKWAGPALRTGERVYSPLNYYARPVNREQRRRLEKELRRQDRKRQGQGNER